MYPQSPSASTGNVRSAALRRGVAVLFATALVVLSGCGTGKAPVGAIPPAAPSYTVPAGWNSFVDPDHGWFTAYPGGWVVFASANTHAWKNFISDDPRIDVSRQSFRLQRGDGLLTVGVDKPAACAERAEEPGETQSRAAIAGRDVDVHHWNPPTSVGAAASEYAIRAVVNGQCYSIFLLFIAVPSATEDSVVRGVTNSFQFAA